MGYLTFSWGKKPLSIERDREGNIFYKMFSSLTSYNNKLTKKKKLEAILQNPAALFVFTLQCDLASLGRFYVYDKDGNEIEDDPILKLLNKPNYMQTGKQFMWDYMFWNMFGQDNIYVDSKSIDNNQLYILQNTNLIIPSTLDHNKNKIVLSQAEYKKIQDTIIKYEQTDGSFFKFKYGKLIQIHDLSNGIDGWYKSPSRLDALYKIVSNSELSLKSKNINTDFMSKFFVSGKIDINNVDQMPMSDNDKRSVRESMFSDESVYPTKSMIDVKRFIDNYGVLDSLDKAFLGDYYLIGKAFGIPRDVLEAYDSATYENQEKARASHISYTIQPKMNDLCNALETYFGYDELGKEICCEYDHLPFVSVFEKEKAETNKTKAETYKILIDSGINPEDALREVEYEDMRTDGIRNMNNGQNTEVNTA